MKCARLTDLQHPLDFRKVIYLDAPFLGDHRGRLNARIASEKRHVVAIPREFVRPRHLSSGVHEMH